MAKYGIYQEIEKSRVVIRQGHFSDKYYFILSGIASIVKATQNENDELIFTLINSLKRGDGFGDLGIINNTRRSASVINNNIEPLFLLSFDKKNYFDIQGSTVTKKDNIEFLKKRCDVFKKLNYQVKKINNIFDDYVMIHFRKSILIFKLKIK